MTDSPRTVSRTRKLARKVVPLRARRVFVTTVERTTRQTWKARKHHKVAAVSRLIADWDACSDPPPESCSDAECPVHGEPEWDSEDSNAYVAEQEAAEAAAWRESRP